MVVNPATPTKEHKARVDLPQYLTPGMRVRLHLR